MSTTTQTRTGFRPYALPPSLGGRPVAGLEDYDPDEDYFHVLAKDSPTMDDAILNGARVVARCGLKWTPVATDFPAPGAAVTIPWCPLCVLLHGYQGRGAR